MDRQFFPGWAPERAAEGLARFESTGRRLFTGTPFVQDTRPLPAAFSLSNFIKWPHNQGQVGSCFSNGTAMSVQILLPALKAAGKPVKPFNPSRAFVWAVARMLDGSFGTRDSEGKIPEGATIINSRAAISDTDKGKGIPPEEVLPYKPDVNWLERKPPESVYEIAGKYRQSDIAVAPYNPEAWKRAIYNAHSVGLGIWWPGANSGESGWDGSWIDKYGRTTAVRGGAYGHAVEVIGWINDWDGHLYWEIQNSHGPIYGEPEPDVQKHILGYKCTKHSFWAREDHLQFVMNKRFSRDSEGYEAFVGGGMSGFDKLDFHDAYAAVTKPPVPIV
jgi:hypothetical protein